jgi:hypothetical protein
MGIAQGLLAKANYRKTLLKIIPILAALAGLSGVTLAHAQSHTAFIGLRETYWKYVVDPSGESGFGPMQHCRQLGWRAAEDLEPRARPFFLPETGSTPSPHRRFGAMASRHAQKKSNGSDRATFFIELPLPSCVRR